MNQVLEGFEFWKGEKIIEVCFACCCSCFGTIFACSPSPFRFLHFLPYVLPFLFDSLQTLVSIFFKKKRRLRSTHLWKNNKKSQDSRFVRALFLMITMCLVKQIRYYKSGSLFCLKYVGLASFILQFQHLCHVKYMFLLTESGPVLEGLWDSSDGIRWSQESRETFEPVSSV